MNEAYSRCSPESLFCNLIKFISFQAGELFVKILQTIFGNDVCAFSCYNDVEEHLKPM